MKRDYVPVQWSDDEALWQAMAPALAMPQRYALAERDVESILATVALPPDARVLDLGCGAGVHAVAFARRGFEVTGVDRSETLLAIARSAAPRCTFINADMREFVREGEFDLACNLYSSFGYFDDASNEQVLRNVHASLKKRGALVLDLLGTWQESAAFGDYAVTRHREGPHLVEEWTVGNQHFRTVQRLYDPTELDELLAQTGFDVVSSAEVLGGTMRRVVATK